MLKNHVITAAFHNAPRALYAVPKCFPGTREAVKSVIMNWIEGGNHSQLFLWLYGPAGSGKSSIAHMIAKICEERDWFGGTFFFSALAPALEDKDRETNIVATIAYQLAQRNHALDEFIRRAMCDDPLIFTKSLDEQLKSLIINPLNSYSAAATDAAYSHELNKPKVVIIDALDESKCPAAQKYILTTLHDALYTSNSEHRLKVPGFLRFLIISRPEQHIRSAFSTGDLSNHTVKIPLDDYCPTKDITRFLEAGFQMIKVSHPRRSDFPDNWPPKRQLENLAKKSSRQFVYAVTAMKYIQSSSNDPIYRLNNIMGKINRQI